MKLTPEQIQGVLELEPKAQIDRLQSAKPYIRTGYWNRNRDLESLNAGLAKLGLKAEEYDDYDEDTGWLYWYALEPISNELSPEDKATVDKYEDDDANREMNRMDADMYKESIDLNRWAELAGIKESYTVISPEDYKEGDKVEINTENYPEHQFPEGTNGIISSVDKADYADDTPVFTVKIKNIDPVFGEQDKLQVEKIRDFK